MLGYDQFPNVDEMQLAEAAFRSLNATMNRHPGEGALLEFEGEAGQIQIPRSALVLLADILKATARGHTISVVPQAAELTTQTAADLIGCSRPHLVKLLENGIIPFTKVGRHRRVSLENVVKYKTRMKRQQARLIAEMMSEDEDSGLYDS